MASDDKQHPPSFPGWAIALIVVSILTVLGILAFVLFGQKAGSTNVGPPIVPSVAPPAVPSMTNISSGNMGAGAARPNLKI